MNQGDREVVGSFLRWLDCESPIHCESSFILQGDRDVNIADAPVRGGVGEPPGVERRAYGAESPDELSPGPPSSGCARSEKTLPMLK